MKKKRCLLEASVALFERIEAAQKKYRPYLESRNYFLTELIVLGLNCLDKKGDVK